MAGHEELELLPRTCTTDHLVSTRRQGRRGWFFSLLLLLLLSFCKVARISQSWNRRRRRHRIVNVLFCFAAWSSGRRRCLQVNN